MGETKKDELPGDDGQFGANVETENYEPLPEPPGAPAAEPAKTPGQHQEQGGMRS